ncbi:MAG: ribosome biogenesis GTPase Der [Desulfovibrionaceae bacterium]|nr:ribosome biogenesis GTPase Der [Desulfovibrionaceae bacterium]
MLPVVALIGRPNVGKSTLFNRLIRSNRAITHDRPGVTRDRMYGEVRRRGAPSWGIVDTGGITLDASGAPGEGPEGVRGFEAEILAQARAAVEEAALLLLVVDGREGLSPLDERLARFARTSGRPVLVVVNKIDGPEQADLLLAEFHAMGLDLLPCSAAHGFGMPALLERVQELLPAEPESEPDDALEEGTDGEFSDQADASPAAEGEAAAADTDDDLPEEPPLPPEVAALRFEDLHLPAGFDLESAELGPDEPEPGEADSAAAGTGTAAPGARTLGHRLDPRRGLRMAMLGKPNAGKSSLVNALSGTSRMIVSDVPGTTRDSVDVTFEKDGARYTFVDTAGVRRRTRVTDQVERYSVNAALKTSQRSDVTFLVLDLAEGLTQQDKRLITFLDRYKIPFITIVNKIDTVERKERKAVLQGFRDALKFCPHVPLVITSARTGAGLDGLLDQARELWRECGVRVSTGRLNRAVQDAIRRHQPPVVKRTRAKFFYLTQAETRPPTFILFVNDPERVKPSYARYLETRLRRDFGIAHAPMRLVLRASHAKKS